MQCIEQGRADITVATNLIEARFITGRKAGFEQLIEFSDGFFGLGGRIDTTFEIGHEIGTHLGGEFHFAAKHAAGNILGTVGNLVLLGQQFQQIGTGDRQKQTARQFEANFAFENVRFFFQLGYLLPDLGALDIRMLALYGKPEFLPADWLWLLLSSLAYAIALLALAVWALQRKRFS